MLKEFILHSLLKVPPHYTRIFLQSRAIEGMSSCKQLEVKAVERNPNKWAVPLREDVFNKFSISHGQGGSSVVWEIFGDGSSLFSPLLFEKFFDPSDAFPLWDFESDILLANLRSCRQKQNTVDWLQTEQEYFLRAPLPAGVVKKYGIEVCIEAGKVLEISGLWKQVEKGKEYYWRSGQWWEHGYVRRVELPDNANWRSTVAYLRDDSTVLEIRIPKYSPDAGASGSSNPVVGIKFQS